MTNEFSIVAIADSLRTFMVGLYQNPKNEMQPTYTTELFNLDSYAINGLTIAINLEYTDDDHPEPMPVFIMAWRDDPQTIVVPFGKSDPLGDEVASEILRQHAKHTLISQGMIDEAAPR